MKLTSGDSQLPEIFQESEADITKSFEPKKVTGTGNVIEQKKDVEITVEQEKNGKYLLLISFIYVFLANLKNTYVFLLTL